jgi:hypothetical protein
VTAALPQASEETRETFFKHCRLSGKPADRRRDSYLTLHYRLSDLDKTDYVSTFDLSPATLQMGSGQLAETLERLPDRHGGWANAASSSSRQKTLSARTIHA